MLGICGSRDFTDYKYFKENVDKFVKEHKITKIISGGCKGADSLAKRYARENKIEIVEHLPEWNKYGKSAGFVRNKLIVNDSDYLLAFPLKGSKGTYITIDLAKKKNIPVFIFQKSF